MFYKVLADIVVFLHLAWIVFLICGAFWGVHNRTVRVLHVGGLGFAILMQAMGWYCPLTHLEFWLRTKHDPRLAYPGSFIAHYAEKMIYLEIQPWIILLLTIVLCAFTAWMYLRKKNRQEIK